MLIQNLLAKCMDHLVLNVLIGVHDLQDIQLLKQGTYIFGDFVCVYDFKAILTQDGRDCALSCCYAPCQANDLKFGPKDGATNYEHVVEEMNNYVQLKAEVEDQSI